jgi:O-antigen ligase
MIRYQASVLRRVADLPAALGQRRREFALVAGVTVYTGVCLYMLRSNLQSQSKSTLILAIAVSLLPMIAIWSLRAPLIFPFGLYMAFIPFDNLITGPVGSVTKLLAIAATAALLLRLFMTRDARVPGRSVVAWGLVVLWITASVTWAINVNVAIENVQSYVQLYLLFAIVAITPVQSNEFKWIVVSVVFGGICAALNGDYLFYHSVGVSVDDRVFVNAGGRKIDPNHFAASLLVPFALSLMLFLRQRTGLRKLGALAVLLIVASGLQIAGSRGGMIAVAFGIIYFLIRSRYRVQLAVITLIGTIGVLSSPLMARFALALSSGGNGRTAIWRTGFAAFKKSWLLGVGTGGFPDAYDRAWLLVNHGRFNHWHNQAHNLIAQTGIELGAVGLVLTAIAWAVQITALRGTSAPEPYGDIRIAIEAGTISLLVSSMFLDLMWYKYLWAVFILAAVARQYARGTEPKTSPANARAAACRYVRSVQLEAKSGFETAMRSEGAPSFGRAERARDVCAAACNNISDCTLAARRVAIDWYPGAGEYCPQCGEALSIVEFAGSASPRGTSSYEGGSRAG